MERLVGPGPTDRFEPRVSANIAPDELRNFRRSLNLDEEQFAAVFGIAAGKTVKRWELGTHAIPQYVERMIGLYNLSPINRKYMFEVGEKEYNDRLARGLLPDPNHLDKAHNDRRRAAKQNKRIQVSNRIDTERY